MTQSMGYLVVAACLAGCADPEFIPVESTRGADTGAYYEMTIDGTNVGDAKVWAYEPEETVVGGAERDVVRIGLRVRNDSGGAFAVVPGRASLEVSTGDEDERRVLDAPSAVRGPTRIEARSTGRLEFEYVLPAGVGVGDVEEVEFNWVVETPLGVYSESTPFAAVRPGAYGDPGAPYWHRPVGYYDTWWNDPYWHPLAYP